MNCECPRWFTRIFLTEAYTVYLQKDISYVKVLLYTSIFLGGEGMIFFLVLLRY